ncbi:MAG: hypothetical protein ACYDHZ_00880 [Dehalococcoidia bacterium]
MLAELEPKRLELVLRKAEDQWYLKHHGEYKYGEHIEFVADYIAHHYNDRRIQ